VAVDVLELLDDPSPERQRFRADRLRESLLQLLAARFPTEVPADLIARLHGETDRRTLERWLIAALKITSIDDIRDLLNS
jgi:hypothetical protein